MESLGQRGQVDSCWLVVGEEVRTQIEPFEIIVSDCSESSKVRRTYHVVLCVRVGGERVGGARSALSTLVCLLASSSAATATRVKAAVKDGCLSGPRRAYVEYG